MKLQPVSNLYKPMRALSRDLELMVEAHQYPGPRIPPTFIANMNYHGATILLATPYCEYETICDAALEIAHKALDLKCELKLVGFVIDPFNPHVPTEFTEDVGGFYSVDAYTLNDIGGFFRFDSTKYVERINKRLEFDYILFIALHGRVDFHGIGALHYDRDKYLNPGDALLMHASTFIKCPDCSQEARIVMFVFQRPRDVFAHYVWSD